MKHPLETALRRRDLTAGPALLLLPAPSGLTLAQKLLRHHAMDLNQLYTVLFCSGFLALGAIEYLVLRWVWRRWFSSSVANQRHFQWARLWFSLRRPAADEGPGKDAGKRPVNKVIL